MNATFSTLWTAALWTATDSPRTRQPLMLGCWTLALLLLTPPLTSQLPAQIPAPGHDPSCASQLVGSCRVGDSIWELSTRSLPDCPAMGVAYAPELCQLAGGMWSPGALESIRELVASPSGPRLVVYVHGNRMPRQQARDRALIIYQNLVSNTNCEPICFVALSWPSEQTERLAQDVERKKRRLSADSYYLASFIRQLELQRPIGYWGYSFGCAIVCGSHHLLAGGSLHGYQLDGPPTALYLDRMSLIAPAFDHQDLTPRGQYHSALSAVDKMVNLYNSVDPILRRFRFFDRSTSPTAAGYAGILDPRSISPLSADGKIVQYDCRVIGRTHAELDYLSCPCITWAFRNVAGL